MKRVFFCLGLLLLSLLFGCDMQKQDDGSRPPDEKYVVAYVFPEDRIIEESSINASFLTHINFAFANIVDGRMVEGFAADGMNLAILRKIRQKNPHLRLLVSVGGWTWSGHFSDVALTPQNRAIFIESAIDFLEKHELDGLDIDWEYPGLPGDNNIYRPEDKENFTALICECRQALDMLGGAEKHYLLTIAAGAFPDYLANTVMEEVAGCLDFINIMTYDFTGEWDQVTGHHANLFAPEHDPTLISVEKSVDLFLEAGVPANKLLIGAAFYGHGWQEVNPENNGLGQPALGLTDHFLIYRNIETHYLTDANYLQLKDSSAAAPFLWNPKEQIFISYEDAESLKEKSEFVREKGLKGIMFWEYFGDHRETLLRAIFECLHD